jgi:enolase
MDELSLSISRMMKVLLKDEATGSYVGREMAWAKNVAAAAEFETLEAAVQKTLDYVREDVVIVLRDEDRKCGLALNRRIR